MASSLIKSVASLFINVLSGKEVMRTAKRQKLGFPALLPSSVTMKVPGKGVTRAGKWYNDIDHMNRKF